MVQYDILGVPVDFPYEAYPPQLEYMTTVIRALQGDSNALLESPTGSGKTLCLLCSTLAWRALVAAKNDLLLQNDPLHETLKAGVGRVAREIPLIIYASRTHSQLSQVLRELRKTIYRPRTALIGSREQLCTNESVRGLKSNAAMTAVCGQLVKRNACEKHSRVDLARSAVAAMQGEGQILDMEDIVKTAGAYGACPFYTSREDVSQAELVLLPYNYLLDSKTRLQQQNILEVLKGSIVIFDEAHNVESSCGDATSTDITQQDLEVALEEVFKVKNHSMNVISGEGAGDCEGTISSILKTLSGITLNDDGNFSADGGYIRNFFQSASITSGNVKATVTKLEAVSKLFVEAEYLRKQRNVSSRLQSLASALRTIFKDSFKDDADKDDRGKENNNITAELQSSKYFRVWVEEGKVGSSLGGGKKRSLSYWCFHPGLAFKALQATNPRSIILTSGTLSPLEAFKGELALSFPHQLENAHVIGDDRVFCSVLSTGPSGSTLSSAYEHRDNLFYKKDLGRCILRIAQNVPDGLLVFFPSYSVMDDCLDVWRREKVSSFNNSSLYEEISRVKSPVMEPRDKGELASAMDRYYKNIESGKGAIFYAVCRGKVSEGLDFSDAKGRAVIVTGIPYPPLKDPRVVLKRQYLDDAKSKDSVDRLTGSEWYRQQASRAVNQAIGRVIRHRHDYGAIILLDQRFAQPSFRNQLSKWLRPHLREDENIETLSSRLQNFFARHTTNTPNIVDVKGALQVERDRQETLFIQQQKRIKAQDSIRDARSFFDNDGTKSPPVTQEEPTIPVQVFSKAFTETVPVPGAAKKDGKEYLDQLRKILPVDAQETFNISLKEYRATRIDIKTLCTTVLDLFCENGGRSLIPGFRDFLSAKHWPLYDQMVSQLPLKLSLKKPTEDTFIINATIAQLCPICKDPIRNVYQAKCRHVCCFACWNTWLQVKLECPVCRTRTRIPQLKKIL